MMRFACPKCSSKLSAPDGSGGSETECPTCGTRLRIPAGAAAYQPPAPDLPLERAGEERVAPDLPLERAPERERWNEGRAVREGRRERDRGRDWDDDEEEDRPRRRHGYECRFCGSTERPEIRQRISTGGWVLFAVLLVFLCWPLCWIGLLIKEDYSCCYDCGRPL
jgi:hypothetical protein